MLARESLAFVKYVPLHALSEHHGVSLGQNYKTPDSAKLFTHYIAEAQRKSFLHSLARTNFPSFLMDGSTDSDNLEQDVVFVVFWKKDSETQQICSVTRYLAVVTPKSGTAEGLVDCLEEAFSRLHIKFSEEIDHPSTSQDCIPILVGGGSDGTSVNIGCHNGVKEKLQTLFPFFLAMVLLPSTGVGM